MGNTISRMEGCFAVARSNSGAPRILRQYNLKDNVFPHKVSRSMELQQSLHLDTSLRDFEKDVTKHLFLSPRLFEATKEGEDMHDGVVNEEEAVKKILIQKGKVCKVYYSPLEDRGQLYMCRQFVVEITEEISRVKDLRILQACCNYLVDLPPQIGNLSNLKVLVLSKNRIQRLPSEIGNLKNLRELNLSQNLLSSIPSEISSLKTLNALHIDNNLFTSLSPVIGKLSGLKYLNISHNKIQKVPLEILKLPFLIELVADFCDFVFESRIEQVGECTLKEMCSRNVIRSNLEIHRNIDKSMMKYLLSVQECSFCSGPLFDGYYLYAGVQIFNSERLPVTYKLCMKHYATHEDRIEALFSKPLESYPHGLLKSGMPAVGELFNSMNYDDLQNKVLSRGLENSASDKMPLICLSRYKGIVCDRISGEEGS